MDNNIKLLVKILGGVLIVIITIVSLYLVNHFFNVNSYGYEIPEININEEENPIENVKVNLLPNNLRYEYNKKLSNNSFLLALNNVIKDKMSYNIDTLLESGSDDRYDFLLYYTKSCDCIYNDEDIKKIYKSIFGEDLSDEGIAYYNDESHYFEIKDVQYVLKAVSSTVKNEYVILNVDLLMYDQNTVDQYYIEYEDYSIIKKGVLTAKMIDDQFYLDSFAFEKEEDDK